MPIYRKDLERLEFAASTGDLEEVERLTRNVHQNSTRHFNIIKIAISAGQIETAKLILNRTGHYFEGNKYFNENEVLHSAIVTGDLELVQLVLQKMPVSIQTPNKDGIPPIFKLAHISSDNVGYTEFLDCLVAKGFHGERIEIINAKHQSRSFTLLHYAAEIGNVNIIPVLIEWKIDLNAESSDGSTALHIAARNRHSQVVLKLLEYKVKDSLVDNNHKTPLYYIIKNGDFVSLNIFLNYIFLSDNLKKQWFQKEVNRPLVYLATDVRNLRMVEFLVSNEAEVNYFSKETGQTPLHLAVEKEDIQIVQLLLKYKADLQNADQNGFTPLHLACVKGNHQIVSMIINTEECRLNTKSKKRLTALHLAVKEGHHKIVSLLLEKGTASEEFNKNNKTSLSFALENTSGDDKTLTVLLKHIREVENKENIFYLEDNLLLKYRTEARNDKNGNSVLHLAVKKEDESAIVMFLKLHACIDSVNKNGYTPFDLATVNGSFSVVDIFLKSRPNPETLFVSSERDGFTPMHFAVQEENTDMLQVFFKAGISADLPFKFENDDTSNGLTPLHVAVRKNIKNLIFLLLKNGAKVDVPGRMDFETPLFTAAELGNTKALEILAEASTLRSSKWKEGYLPMCIAAYGGHVEIVKLLLTKGVDPNANLDSYLTPLHAAAQQGHEKIVRLLLKHGAMVNPHGEFFSTPLFGACFAKHSRIVQLLLKQGADFNVQLKSVCKNSSSSQLTINPSVLLTKQILTQGNYKDSEIGEEGSLVGYSPLHFAVEEGNEEVVKSLVNLGVNVNLKAENGATAIGLAIEKEMEIIIKLLLSADSKVLNTHKHKSLLDIGVLKTNAKIAEIIVKYISCLDSKNVTPLKIAIKNEFESCVERLLQAGSSLLVKDNRESLMYIAVDKKNSTIVQLLLKYGFDPNCLDGHFALMIAVENEDANIVNLLLDAGANIIVYLALNRAIELKNVTIVELFLKKSFIYSDCNWDSPFRQALRKSSPQVVQKFLDYNVSTDTKREKGECPIFYAIVGKNLEVVLHLLKVGDYINATTKEGENILHFAMSKINFDAELYQILVDHGIDLNTPNKERQYPMIRILKKKKYQNEFMEFEDSRNSLLNILLSNGVNPNQLVKGMKILEYAIYNEKISGLRVLLLNGADVNFRNASNKTPLQVAIDRALKCSADYEAQSGPFNSLENNSKDIDNLEYDKFYASSCWTFLSRRIVRLLVQEIARLQAAKEEISEMDISLISLQYLKKYYQQCQAEIDLMKVTEIFQRITYFDILVAKFNDLASYAREIKVKRVLLSEGEVLVLFPKYGKLLIDRIVMGRDRRHLLDSCYHILRAILRFDFPHLVVEHIFSYLGNKDLRTLYVTLEQ